MFREELKKIWNLRSVVIFAILGIFFWVIWMSYNVQYFPNGAENRVMFQKQAEWVEKYGTTLEDNEINEIRAALPELYAQIEGTFEGEPLFQKYGITTYLEFKNFVEQSWEDEELSEDANVMQEYLKGDKEDGAYWEVYAIEESLRFVDEYQTAGEHFFDYLLGEEKYMEREYHNIVHIAIEEEGWRNILFYEVPQATTNYWNALMSLGMLAVCILTAPLLVRERMNRMRSLQWSSKQGRSVIWKQFGAVVLSAVIILTVYLVIFGAIFATNKTWLFWDCRMYSFDTMIGCWGNWTYGTYCMVLVGIYYLVGIASCGLAFLISYVSSNYVSMLLKLIPVLVVLLLGCSNFAFEAFYYWNQLYCLTRIPYIEAIAPAVLFLAAMGVVSVVCRRQKKAELLVE